MTGDAIKGEAGFVKGIPDLFCGFKESAALEHVITRLRARRAGLFGIRQEVGERLPAVLRAFDGCVETRCGHDVLRVEMIFA